MDPWQRLLAEIVILAAYMGLEFWLGRTKRTSAASLVELVLTLISRKK